LNQPSGVNASRQLGRVEVAGGHHVAAHLELPGLPLVHERAVGIDDPHGARRDRASYLDERLLVGGALEREPVVVADA